MINQDIFCSKTGELNHDAKSQLLEFLHDACKGISGVTVNFKTVQPSESIETPSALFEWCDKNGIHSTMPVLANGDTFSIYGGSLNEFMRYWHDLTHCKLRTDFSLEGETLTATEQVKQMMLYGLNPVLVNAVWCDFYGQAAYYNKHKKFIKNGILFVKQAMIDQNATIADYIEHD